MNPRRRGIIGLAGACLLAAPRARAQPRGRVPLLVVALDRPDRQLTSLRERLAKEGFADGSTLRIETVYIAGGPPETVEARARAAIARRPDAIFTPFGPEVVLLQHLTRDIPIVFSIARWTPPGRG